MMNTKFYNPSKDNYMPISSCTTCHRNSQKPLDLHDLNHSSVSVANSPNDDEPPTKLRIANTIINPAVSETEVSQIEIEPKIDYDAIRGESMHNDDNDDEDSRSQRHVSEAIEDEHHQLQQQHQQDMSFERIYFMQQQQQQQQHSHHTSMDGAMQDSVGSNSLSQRKERMSKKQKDIYVNFLEQNPSINQHRRNDPLLDHYWSKLADILNTIPQGAVKHVAEWKQTFDNWRYRVFLYARYNSKISGKESLNPKSFKPLTHTDKRAYSIWIRNPDTAPPDLDKMRNVFINLEETQQE